MTLKINSMSLFANVNFISHIFSLTSMCFFSTIQKEFIWKTKGIVPTGGNSRRQITIAIMITPGFTRTHCPNFKPTDLKVWLVVSRLTQIVQYLLRSNVNSRPGFA